jgi:LemA protein
MEAGTIALIIVVVLVLLLIGYPILAYNRLVSQRNRTEEAWSQIDVQLQRRHDLIPNLVETVQGYASHERETLESVTQARNAAVSAGTPAEHAQAEDGLTGVLRQLFALQEAYPDLKADANFRRLQEELSSTEDRIGYARQFYNDAVQNYDTTRETFPTNVVAGAFGFEEIEYFEISTPEVRSVPQVEF